MDAWAERLAVEARAIASVAAIAFDATGRRSSQVLLAGYLKHPASFSRVPEALVKLGR